MPSADPRRQLAEYRGLFDTTGNPIWLWIAYRWCRICHRGLPRWILLEFDRIGDRLANTHGPKEQPIFGAPKYKHWLEAVAEASGFNCRTGGGSTDPFAARILQVDNLHLAIRMRVLVDGEGMDQPTKAADVVAADCDVDSKTIEDAWKQFHHVARMGNLEEQRREVARLNTEIAIYKDQHGSSIALGRPITAPLRRKIKPRTIRDRSQSKKLA